MTPPLPPKAQKLLEALMGLAALLHAAQLPLYPVNAKWWVAFSAAIAYTVSTFGIVRRQTFGYAIACGLPILASIFVGLVLVVGPPPGLQGQMQFNPFTALAAVVEVPAVFLAARALVESRRR